MRKIVILTAALAFAVPAAAQGKPEETPLADMAGDLSDPERQAEMALMLQAMGEILLDMPVGPMMEAVAEMGAEVASQQARQIDPDTTLRRLAPGAGRVTAQIAEQTPRMMRAMGAMAKGMARMAPALRDMTRRMEENFPAARD